MCAWLAPCVRRPQAQVLALLIDIASGMLYLHSRNVLHVRRRRGACLPAHVCGAVRLFLVTQLRHLCCASNDTHTQSMALHACLHVALHLHVQGDLKPGNVLIKRKPQASILGAVAKVRVGGCSAACQAAIQAALTLAATCGTTRPCPCTCSLLCR